MSNFCIGACASSEIPNPIGVVASEKGGQGGKSCRPDTSSKISPQLTPRISSASSKTEAHMQHWQASEEMSRANTASSRSSNLRATDLYPVATANEPLLETT